LLRNEGALSGTYSLKDLKVELKPFTDYYEDFNLRAKALDYYEARLDNIQDNDGNMRDYQ
jgi:hypothetical protein